MAVVQPVVEPARPAVEELLNQGAAIFARCQASTDDDSLEHLAPLIFFHHTLEMLDSSWALARRGRCAGALPCLRSAFEGTLSLRYVLAGSRDQLRERGMAFLVSVMHHRIRAFEILIEGTDRRRRFLSAIGADAFLGGDEELEFPPLSSATDSRQRISAMLDRDPLWTSASQEYNRTKQRRKSRPHWYSLFDGPSHLRALASTVQMSGFYDFLYQQWSRTTHGVDFDRILGGARNVGATFSRIPDATRVATLVSFLMFFGLNASRTILSYYRGEEEFFARWYSAEIRSTYQAISRSLSGDLQREMQP